MCVCACVCVCVLCMCALTSSNMFDVHTLAHTMKNACFTNIFMWFPQDPNADICTDDAERQHTAAKHVASMKANIDVHTTNDVHVNLINKSPSSPKAQRSTITQPAQITQQDINTQPVRRHPIGDTQPVSTMQATVNTEFSVGTGTLSQSIKQGALYTQPKVTLQTADNVPTKTESQSNHLNNLYFSLDSGQNKHVRLGERRAPLDERTNETFNAKQTGSLGPSHVLQHGSSRQEVTSKKLLQPPTSSSDRIQPPTSSSDHIQPPTSSSDHIQPPTSSSDHIQPPTSSSDQFQPPTSSSDQFQPPTSSSDQFQSPTSSSDHIQPPTSSSDHIQPPTSSSDHIQPPTSSSDHIQPPTSSSAHIEPSPYLHHIQPSVTAESPELRKTSTPSTSSDRGSEHENRVPTKPPRLSPLTLNDDHEEIREFSVAGELESPPESPKMKPDHVIAQQLSLTDNEDEREQLYPRSESITSPTLNDSITDPKLRHLHDMFPEENLEKLARLLEENGNVAKVVAVLIGDGNLARTSDVTQDDTYSDQDYNSFRKSMELLSTLSMHTGCTCMYIRVGPCT